MPARLSTSASSRLRGPFRRGGGRNPLRRLEERSLTAGAREAAKEVRKIVRKPLAPVRRGRKRRKPTGALARSIKAVKARLRAGNREMGTYYATFLELGWKVGSRKTRSRRAGPPREVAYPFLLRGVERADRRMLDKIGEAWIRGLDKLRG